MCREHVELVRRKYEAWNRGDIETLIALTHPDFQWVEPPEIVGATNGSGRKEYERYLRSFYEVWEEFRWEPEEFRSAGDLLVVHVREIGRGKLSGALVQQRFVHVWTIRDGRSVRMERYVDQREAFASVLSRGRRSSATARQAA